MEAGGWTGKRELMSQATGPESAPGPGEGGRPEPDGASGEAWKRKT